MPELPADTDRFIAELDAAVEAAIRRSNPFRPLPPDFADPTYVTAAIPIQPGGQ